MLEVQRVGLRDNKVYEPPPLRWPCRCDRRILRRADDDGKSSDDGGKRFNVLSVNGRHIEPFSSVIGRFPVVICSPEYTPITSAGPSERRRFVDFVVSQSNSLYFQHLLEYRRVLRHRNKILFDARRARQDPGTLTEPWDEQLVAIGSALTYRRNRFVEEFQEYVSRAYHH